MCKRIQMGIALFFCAVFYALIQSSAYAATIPTSPTGLKASCPVPGIVATVSWTPVAGATSYGLRVDDTTNPWKNSCAVAQYAGDICLNNVTTNSYRFVATPGHIYTWWVHAINSAGWSSAAGTSPVTCVAPSPTPVPGPICKPACTSGTYCYQPSPVCPTGQACLFAIVEPHCVPNPTVKPSVTPQPSVTLPPSTTPQPTIPSCPLRSQGDADCNGVVDYTDFSLWFNTVLGAKVCPSSTHPTCSADFNNDGDVNLFDFEIWRQTTYN
jgi:hypothetical protein